MIGATSARCPTPFELGAALRVATVLEPRATPRAAAHASYALIPTGGVYRQDHFAQAELLLERCKLLEVEGQLVKPSPQLLEICRLPPDQAMELLLLATVERAPPVWIFAASEGVELVREAIPDEDWAVFELVIDDPARREEFLLGLGRRFDMDEMAALGAQGEIFVAEQCMHELTRLGYPKLAERVRRVSLISDQLGYDVVAPTLTGDPWRIEVKTTRSSGALVRIIITRNEARVGLSDRRWVLVICLQTDANGYQVMGWCQSEAFSTILPKDTASDTRWLSARLTLRRSQLTAGLPSFARDGEAA